MEMSDRLLDRIVGLISMVQAYESPDLQKAALREVPLEQIDKDVGRKILPLEQKGAAQERIRIEKECLKLKALLKWFRDDFFEWADTVPCRVCRGTTAFNGYSNRFLNTAALIEVFMCQRCSAETEFPRYIDASILLTTRMGRCLEWGQVFCLICRAFGWKSRYIYDYSDHAWVEIYSPYQRRWIHCDPCEAAFDTPLMYEVGWKKKLTYIVGVSSEDIQDVTWRYSANHKDVLSRRNQLANENFLRKILYWREHLQVNLPDEKRKELAHILVSELVELMTEPKIVGSYGGRTSGNLDWRLSRNEYSPELAESYIPRPEHPGYVWTPEPYEVENKFVKITYNCASNGYSRDEPMNVLLRGWESGSFEFCNIFRKVERDWKMVYLAREEWSSPGYIVWKISFESTDFVVESIKIKCVSFQIKDCVVKWSVSNTVKEIEFCGEEHETAALAGSKIILIKATLSGGTEEIAYQHAQLFRQAADCKDSSMEILINFKPDSEA